MEPQLKKDCQTLLKQLQRSQLMLNREVATRIGASKNISIDSEKYILESVHARNKLSRAAKISQDALADGPDVNNKKDAVSDQEDIYGKNKNIFKLETEKLHDGSKVPPRDCSAESTRSRLQTLQSELWEEKMSSAENTNIVTSSSWQPASPETQRKRNIIDRHIHVPTCLDAQELKNLKKERMLNFSYSHISPDGDLPMLVDFDLNFEKNGAREPCESDQRLQKSPANESCAALKDQIPKQKKQHSVIIHSTNIDKLNDDKRTHSDRLRGSTSHVNKESALNVLQTFRQQLHDEGNSRKLNSFIKDTTIKPKSLLNSTSYSLHNLSSSRKNNSGERRDTTANTQSSLQDQRLLGYDWIAALLDNDSDLVDQSESFFNELREFRRAYKDECSNKFYMEGPHMLVDLDPELVIEASKEPKVEHYYVNERLFTVPLHPEPDGSNFVDYEQEVLGLSPQGSNKEPTEDNPRFVCVSIPRSTLRSPYRVRPHRRGSFDASDSCSLIDHCLLGSQNATPMMIPAAKSLDLKNEVRAGNDLQKTTMAEAQKLAWMSGRGGWPFYEPTPRLQLIPLWQKKYSEMARKMTAPPIISANCTISGAPELTKRVTDTLLNSAYATMYEMERLKEQRKLENKMKKLDK